MTTSGDHLDGQSGYAAARLHHQMLSPDTELLIGLADHLPQPFRHFGDSINSDNPALILHLAEIGMLSSGCSNFLIDVHDHRLRYTSIGNRL